MNIYDVIVRPIVTEKAVGKKEAENTMCFQVSKDATKTEIKSAVQKIFKVKVADVHTVNNLGKLRRRGRFTGYRPDWKKAYVTLKPGQELNLSGEAA